MPSPSLGHIFRVLGPFSACSQGLPVPTTAQQGAFLLLILGCQAGPCLSCLDTCGRRLRPPPPAAFDLLAVALGEQRRLRSFAAWSLGASSPPGLLQLGGEKLHFHLHPSIPLPALELFLEPKGRKGHGLASLPPLCSCPFIPLFPAAANGFACQRSHLSVLAPFHPALPKCRGWAALVGERGGKSTRLLARVRGRASCGAPSC